jgi:hypothetical protein
MKPSKIIILTALKSEAEPLIKHFELMRLSQSIFYRNQIALLITGVGDSNVRNSLQSHLQNVNFNHNSFFVNIGVAGGKPDIGLIGDCFLINKLSHETNDFPNYPDILIKHNFKECSLTTVQSPVINGHENFLGLVDMEATTIWSTLKSKVQPHQIIFLKVISDYMSFSKDEIKNFHPLTKKLIQEHLPSFSKFIKTLMTIKFSTKTELSDEENQLINSIAAKLRLTQTQILKLNQLADNAKMNQHDLCNLLSPFFNIPSHDKHQRNTIFYQIEAKLSI